MLIASASFPFLSHLSPLYPDFSILHAPTSTLLLSSSTPTTPYFGLPNTNIASCLTGASKDDLCLESESQQKVSQFRNRVVFGLGICKTVGGAALAGGWVFTVVLVAPVFVGAHEYFELVRSHGITEGMMPPPCCVAQVCPVICALMPMFIMFCGHIDVSVTSAAFVVAMALLLQRGSPHFAQLSGAIFGLFYCGYLPCFCVKLRCGLAAPLLNRKLFLLGLGATWPVLIGGQDHWRVGRVAFFIAISGIIAAGTFALLGGKAFGRTPLTSMSPKKTWEGIIIGFCGCIVTAVILSKIFSWPTSLLIRRNTGQSRQLYIHWCTCLLFCQNISTSLWSMKQNEIMVTID